MQNGTFCINPNYSDNTQKLLLKQRDFNCGGFALGTYTWYVPLLTLSTEVLIDETLEDFNDSAAFTELYDTTDQNELYDNYEINVVKDFVTNFSFDDYRQIQANFYDEIDETALAMGYNEDELPAIEKSIYEWFNYSHPVAVKIATQHLLKTFPILRLIDNISELKPNEYCVAYGTSENDFHFAKYIGGKWYHKMGMSEIKEVPSMKEAFLYYLGETVLFAKPIDEIKDVHII